MRDKYLKIIDHYGAQHQQKKFCEEFYELEEAIKEYEVFAFYFSNDYKFCEYSDRLKINITEELADLINLIEQFRNHYNIRLKDIEKIALEKVERQLGRIESESKK